MQKEIAQRGVELEAAQSALKEALDELVEARRTIGILRDLERGGSQVNADIQREWKKARERIVVLEGVLGEYAQGSTSWCTGDKPCGACTRCRARALLAPPAATEEE